jgi:hypothetical protein
VLNLRNGWEITETAWARKTSLLPEAAARIIIATQKTARPQRTLKYQLFKNFCKVRRTSFRKLPHFSGES